TSVSVRARSWPQFTGTAYFDDFYLIPLPSENLIYNPGFESGKPALWHPVVGNSGATLSWATDQYHSASHSLKIVKTSTGTGAAMWQSDNMVRYWTARIYGGIDIKLGAYVMTQNVNTNPANQDGQWYIQYTFLDSAGAMIGGQPFILPIPQSSASTGGWVADTNGVGTVILPKDAWSLVVSVVGGKNATGTVWVDDFMFLGRNNQWAGEMFNQALEADDGWFYWEPNGLVAGPVYWPSAIFSGSGVTNEAAHTGSYSFKLNAPVGRQPGEIVWISKFIPIPPNSAGKKYVLSAWVKTKGINLDSLKNNSAYRIGFTWTWMKGVNDTATGWNEDKAEDYQFTLPAADTATDWTQYATIITVPDNNVTSVSVRARSWPQFTGTAYYDDFQLASLPTVIVTGIRDDRPASRNTLPTEFSLSQNYPNPFNPSTVISYDIPKKSHVSLKVYNIVGQEVATLFDGEREPGSYVAVFDAGKLSSGVYLYILQAGETRITHKMLLLK
ncbi:MAG: T9SS type A sorting domain-containing protein, partial [Candidatus Kryptoniota bacterium]